MAGTDLSGFGLDPKELIREALKGMSLRGLARRLVKARDVRNRYLHAPDAAVHFLAEEARKNALLIAIENNRTEPNDVDRWRAAERVLQDAFLGDIKVP